jgi:RNA polymerase sigma-70 factor (ECF subfamily)
VIPTQTMDMEAHLIEEAKNGDRNAFGELVRYHYQRVVLVVYRMCGDPTLAEDAAQEAFIRAWMNLPSYEPGGSLRNWFLRIAINATLDKLRQRPETSIEPEELQMIPDPAPDPERALMRKEEAMMVKQVISSLPEAARSVLVLREYGELTYQEIASVLNIPIGTVMSRLNYARNRLKVALDSMVIKMENEYA